MTEKLCMGCMQERYENEAFCGYCGYKHGDENSPRGLCAGTLLRERYLIGKVLGEGGFGITYIGFDQTLQNRVAVKEYFPSELVTRDTSTGAKTELSVLTGGSAEQYKKGLERIPVDMRCAKIRVEDKRLAFESIEEGDRLEHGPFNNIYTNLVRFVEE
ncbi:MAG: hypothetical protein K5697_07065 [Lachnospiraceae bacterium]|nr:hypothetical protein [Lachnospiraceae bacterium]